jgi:acid ceramidase
MKTLILFCLAFVLTYGVYVPLPDPYTDDCLLDHGINKYDNNSANRAPVYIIELNQTASQRWNQIGQIYGKNIEMLVGNLTKWLIPMLDRLNFTNAYNQTLDFMENSVLPKIQNPYHDEIVGLATAANLPPGMIVLYNIFYEVFTVCTSIVAIDDNNHMYHARNLDFGLLLGWNNVTHEWGVTENLRKMIFTLDWQRNGQHVFYSTQFAGYIGVLSGMKTGAFSVTVDDRFMLVGGLVGLWNWYHGESDVKFTTWLTRECFENETVASFNDAIAHLSNTNIMAPVYYIVGGSEPFEGKLLARSLNATDIVTAMNMTDNVQGWYVLETNYDQGTDVLYLDDRRTPGHYCMQKLGRSNVNFQGLYNVMNSKTTLNMLTTYTVLMDIEAGLIETYVVTCDHPCYAW